MMLYENTDLKNTVFGEYGEEKFIKVIYQGYHREGLHQVRLKWYPEAVDNDDEIKLVHESLFMDYQTTEKPAELQSDSILLKKKQKRHKPL
jgi:hypothetical protein